MSASAVGTSSNRYLKVDQTAASAATAESSLCIDFLTFTGDVVCTLRNLGLRTSDLHALESAFESGEGIEQVAFALADHFLDGTGIEVERELRGFRNFYAHHVRLMVGDLFVGFVALGGERQRGTFCLELTGAGCAHVMGWAQLRAKLESAGCKLTRVDVAYDDFKGTHGLDHVERLHADGAFTTSGRPPVLGRQGWSDASGNTVYIGKNRGNQQLCVYEKGKQLGDPESPWVRWEARFGAKYRNIPYDVLTAPADYFLGHYPALDFIRAVARRMVTHVKRAAATLAKSLHWCKHQYGGLLNLLAIHHKDMRDFGVVVDTLRKPKLPGWCSDIPHAAIARHAAVALRFAELRGI